jgi:oligosaccharide reducing-end xylanase
MNGRLFLIMFLPANAFLLRAQVIEAPYEVCTWASCAEAAITFTFDDATSNQYSIVIPMFNEYDFDATFYPVVNWSPDWNQFQKAADQGHEVGSHTMNHPHLDQLTAEEQEAELKDSRSEINSRISGQKCLTIAYSYCVPSIDTLTSKYYIAARHCQGYTEKATPEDFLNISSIICGSQGSIKTTKDFVDISQSAVTTHGWNVYLLHGIDDDGGYSALSSDTLRAALEYYDKYRDTYWVANFVNVVRYIRERNAVSVRVLSSNEDTLKINIYDTLDNGIYHIPVSVRTPLPAEWDYAQAFQDGDSVGTLVKEFDNQKYLVFDVVPDAGLVEITSAEVPFFADLAHDLKHREKLLHRSTHPYRKEISSLENTNSAEMADEEF